MHAVVLNRNGRLLHTSMDDNNGNGHARQVSRDVTKEAHSYLFEPVVLGPGVRLMDLFFVLSVCEPLRDIYRRQWAHELLQEVCQSSPTPYTGQHDAQGIEYLGQHLASALRDLVGSANVSEKGHRTCTHVAVGRINQNFHRCLRSSMHVRLQRAGNCAACERFVGET